LRLRLEGYAKRATLDAMPFGISVWELLILLLVILLVFGPKRLPEMGRQLGKGMREFKESITGKDDDDEDRPELPIGTQDTTAPAPPREG
jgi:sec-independent protein translocase protein TatA